MVAGVLLLADLFLHKTISDLSDWFVKAYGFHRYNQDILYVLAAPCVLGVLLLSVRLGRQLGQPTVSGPLLALTAMTVLAHQYLIVANIEVIHFPQYAIPAAVFLGGGLSPLGSWLAATFCGVIDEVYQHLVIYAGVPGTYLDYNDMILNAIGAAWAIVLLQSWSAVAPSVRREPISLARRRPWLCAGSLGCLLVFAQWLDPPQLSPFLRRGLTGRWYHVLSLPEALLWASLIAVTVVLPSLAPHEVRGAQANQSDPGAIAGQSETTACRSSPG
ncbi:MAG: hypothetical protein LUQ45_03950 [Methanoregulaceae archaeon]|nr:hypothetical protein [Methanoregulaceae archaeon]